MPPARRPSITREMVAFTFDHPAVTATTTWKIAKVTGPFRVTAVRYINPTGLAEDAANSFAITARNGATVIADGLDTNTAGAGVLTADTFTDLVLSATDANRVLATSDVLSLVVTETGIATLPAGRLQVEGFYL